MISGMKYLELELHSQCNRKCPWCPNKDIDRTFYEEMSDEHFTKILKELGEDGFGQNVFVQIVIGRYHEPFLNPELLKRRTREINKTFPNARVVVKTNGDFVNEESLENLVIDRLNIMDYDMEGMKKCKKRVKDLGFSIIEIKEDTKTIHAKSKNIDKLIYKVDWPKHALLEDRGGILDDEFIYNEDKPLLWRGKKEKRDYVCSEPSLSIYVDYNGNVMPCCHMRSDHDKHKRFILGNIKEKTLPEIYNSKFVFDLYNKFSTVETMPEICKYCNKDREGRTHAKKVNGNIV